MGFFCGRCGITGTGQHQCNASDEHSFGFWISTAYDRIARRLSAVFDPSAIVGVRLETAEHGGAVREWTVHGDGSLSLVAVLDRGPGRGTERVLTFGADEVRQLKSSGVATECGDKLCNECAVTTYSINEFERAAKEALLRGKYNVTAGGYTGHVIKHRRDDQRPGHLFIPLPPPPRDERQAAARALGYLIGLIIWAVIFGYTSVRRHYNDRAECSKGQYAFYCERVAESWLRWLP